MLRSRNINQLYDTFQSASARRWNTPVWPSPSLPSPTSLLSASAAPRFSRPSARSASTPQSASWQSTPSNAGMRARRTLECHSNQEQAVEKKQVWPFFFVVQLLHILTQADFSCTTIARLFFFPLLDQEHSKLQGGASPLRPGLGWLRFLEFYCLPNSVWADRNLAELSGQQGKMVDHPNLSQPKQGLGGDAPPSSEGIVRLKVLNYKSLIRLIYGQLLPRLDDPRPEKNWVQAQRVLSLLLALGLETQSPQSEKLAQDYIFRLQQIPHPHSSQGEFKSPDCIFLQYTSFKGAFI